MDLRRIFILQPMRGGRDKSQDYVLGLILQEIKHLRREVAELRKEQGIMQQQVQDAFDDLNEKVTNIESAEQAAETLLTSLNEQLQAALNSSNDPTEVVSNIRAISDRLNTDAQGLAAAVTANTPAAPAPVEEPPVEEPPVGGDATDPTA